MCSKIHIESQTDDKRKGKIIMKIYTECSLENFTPWSGAVHTFNHIMEEGGMENLERVLEDLYPDGIDETALNDIFWFEPE